jgi:alkyl hydroperoxide reductase subunit AhpF
MPETVLNDGLKKQILDIFNAQLLHPVEIIFFSKLDNCESCKDTKILLEELSSLSEKIFLKTYSYDENPKLAHQYKIDLTPSLVIAGREPGKIIDYGIRFSGLPSGYEFSSLIQAIILVSKRDSGLKLETRKTLHELKSPVNLKVFATPT